MTLSHFDQIGSIKMFTSYVWMRNEAWPIHVMQISPWRIFGNCGGTYSPDRFTNSDGIKTLVRKLRLCQSDRGRSRTRVECRPAVTGVSPSWVWRTMFRRFFFGKRIGTVLERYGTVTKWKALKRYKLQTWQFIDLDVQAQSFDLVTFNIRRSVNLFTCGTGSSASYCF
jgi:hypothetical protein